MACPGQGPPQGGVCTVQASNLLCLWFYENLIMVHLGGGLEAGLKLSNLDTKKKEKECCLELWTNGSLKMRWVLWVGCSCVHPRRASITRLL